MTTASTPAEPVVAMYSTEFGDTLTGFEELAISKAWGKSIDALGAEGSMTGVRALIFAHRRREGDKDRDAKAHAMELTRGQVVAYFEGLGQRPDGESDEAEGKD